MPKIMDEEEDDEAAGGNQRSEEELIRLREDSDYESSSCSDSHSDATSGGSESGLEDDELGNAIHGDQTTGTTSETVAVNVVSSGPVDADGLATTMCQAIVEPAVGESCQEAKEVGLSTVNGVGGTSTKVEEVDGFNASLSSAVDQNSEKPVVLPCAVDPPGKKPTALQKKERRRRERAVKARAAVAAREAEAAAANLALLPEEPLDRLSNVVGQALRAGKTVVYSVMRSAARQPNGELIPVGGGGGGSSFMMGGSGGSTSGLMVGLGGSQNASGIGHMTHMSIAHSNISNLGSYASLGVDKIQTGNIAGEIFSLLLLWLHYC
ncbi:unnamed protein product [Protopolystoma xenopodis]|uniref:Uncharacterized protein n=1 Tax=Protopolystoma xenopodis TaxID=117903 RepID=A0A3S5AQI6_9PLAT|nr:unnamed protein product [Protopolystoma xenopodis]